MSSNGDLELALAPFFTVDQVLGMPISTLSVNFALYGMPSPPVPSWQDDILTCSPPPGIYIVVFGLAIHVLWRRNSVATSLYKGCTIALFAFATVYVTIFSWDIYRQATIAFEATTNESYDHLFDFLTHDKTRTALNTLVNIISTSMNVIADTMLMASFTDETPTGIDMGCVILGTIGSGNNTVKPVMTAGKVDEGTIIAIAVFQIFLALLTGGRIWWISRQARRLMGRSTSTKYNAIVAIIIESGALYASVLLVYVVFELVVDSSYTGRPPFDPAAVVVMMSGIAPTLIIVRVAYRKSVENVEQMVSTFHCAADGQDNQQRSSQAAGRQPTIVLHLRTHRGSDNESPIEGIGIPETKEV
ncbi:hypothetical protein PM082_009370 [Marasmius tenuissimus]|nr:hypothetical protein PM082_009370 [Marasmius tenuissimus]